MQTGMFLAVVVAAGLAACVDPQQATPSLQPRPAEAIDPRVGISAPINTRPASSALLNRLAELVEQARSGDTAFQPLADQAERLSATAGESRSESWVVAQEALSAAIAARAPTTRALGEIDAIGATMLQTNGGIAPKALAAIQEAAADVGEIDRRQAERIDAIQRRLGL